MDELAKYWPIVTTFALVVAWLVRMEVKGRDHDDRLKEKGSVESVTACETAVKTLVEHMKEFYATKVEVAHVQGAVGGLTTQIDNISDSTKRIETKVDALLMAKAETPGTRRQV